MGKLELRKILIRSKARKFAQDVRLSGMAHHIPDEIIDFLADDEFGPFKDHLKEFRLVMRPDHRWEERREH